MNNAQRARAWGELQTIWAYLGTNHEWVYYESGHAGYPSAAAEHVSVSSSGISDAAGNTAAQHAMGRYEDGFLKAAAMLDEFVVRAVDEGRRMRKAVESVRPEGYKPPVWNCERCGKAVTLMEEFREGMCHRCYGAAKGCKVCHVVPDAEAGERLKDGLCRKHYMREYRAKKLYSEKRVTKGEGVVTRLTAD